MENHHHSNFRPTPLVMFTHYLTPQMGSFHFCNKLLQAYGGFLRAMSEGNPTKHDELWRQKKSPVDKEPVPGNVQSAEIFALLLLEYLMVQSSNLNVVLMSQLNAIVELRTFY